MLKRALKQNSYVRPYLLGENYADDFMIGWNLTLGALDWLKGFSQR